MKKIFLFLFFMINLTLIFAITRSFLDTNFYYGGNFSLPDESGNVVSGDFGGRIKNNFTIDLKVLKNNTYLNDNNGIYYVCKNDNVQLTTNLLSYNYRVYDPFNVSIGSLASTSSQKAINCNQDICKNQLPNYNVRTGGSSCRNSNNIQLFTFHNDSLYIRNDSSNKLGINVIEVNYKDCDSSSCNCYFGGSNENARVYSLMEYKLLLNNTLLNLNQPATIQINLNKGLNELNYNVKYNSRLFLYDSDNSILGKVGFCLQKSHHTCYGDNEYKNLGNTEIKIFAYPSDFNGVEVSADPNQIKTSDLTSDEGAEVNLTIKNKDNFYNITLTSISITPLDNNFVITPQQYNEIIPANTTTIIPIHIKYNGLTPPSTFNLSLLFNVSDPLRCTGNDLITSSINIDVEQSLNSYDTYPKITNYPDSSDYGQNFSVFYNICLNYTGESFETKNVTYRILKNGISIGDGKEIFNSGNTCISKNIETTCDADEVSITVETDYNNGIEESNENNNNDSITIPCIQQLQCYASPDSLIFIKGISTSQISNLMCKDIEGNFQSCPILYTLNYTKNPDYTCFDAYDSYNNPNINFNVSYNGNDCGSTSSGDIIETFNINITNSDQTKIWRCSIDANVTSMACPDYI